jgi:S-formylglutathione hydrolase FrmB
MAILRSMLFFYLALIAVPAMAQNHGKLLEQRTVKSAILGKNVNYSVYLPADYDISERTYPVVYLLHGYTDDHTGWVQFGEVNRLADKAIAEGVIPPMIIIMPNGDSSFYINSYDGKENYEDFFVKEFMPAVEKAYRIKADKRYHGIAGLSMGGYGTLIYLLKYPQLFAAGGALSAAVLTDSDISTMKEDAYQRTFAQLFGANLNGNNRLTSAWYKNSILKLVETKSTEDLKQVRFWIDCGDKDHLSKGNCLLHNALMEKNVPHEFRVREGAHNWDYWRTGIVDALAFIGKSFSQ